ncbi:hypothetical protein, partial [Xanthomonas phaseoli]
AAAPAAGGCGDNGGRRSFKRLVEGGGATDTPRLSSTVDGWRVWIDLNLDVAGYLLEQIKHAAAPAPRRDATIRADSSGSSREIGLFNQWVKIFIPTAYLLR